MATPRKRIVLVGPSSEYFKGGIAHFTHRLADEIDARADLLFVTWIRMYPPFLLRRDFRDSTSELVAGTTHAERLLDYINPLSWITFIKRVARFNPEVIVFTWSHPVHAPLYWILNQVLRRTKATLTYVCHNVLPHENFPGATLLTKHTFSSIDCLITHSRSETGRANSLQVPCSIKTLFLPLFDFAAPLPPADDSKTLLFFGNIRPYKGLDILFKALAQALLEVPDIRLIVVGEHFYNPDESPDSIQAQSVEDNPFPLLKQLGIEDSVELHVRYVANEEIPGFFSRASLSVFPYRAASQSGSLMLSYHFGVPVIASEVGGLQDVVEPSVSGFLTPANDPQALAQTILHALANLPSRDSVRAYSEQFSWDRYVTAVLGKL